MPRPNGFIESLSVAGLLLSCLLFGVFTAKDFKFLQAVSILGVAAGAGGAIAGGLAHQNYFAQEELERVVSELDAKEKALHGKERELFTLNSQFSKLQAELFDTRHLLDLLRNAPAPVDTSHTIAAEYEARIRSLHIQYRNEISRLQEEARQAGELKQAEYDGQIETLHQNYQLEFQKIKAEAKLKREAELEQVKAQLRAETENEINRLRAEMVDADRRIQEFEKRFIGRAQETLSDALNSLHTRIEDLVQDNLRKAGDLDDLKCDRAFVERLQRVSEEIEVLHERYIEKICALSEFLDKEGILDCSDEALSLLFHLLNDYTNLKVKVINALKAKTVRELQAVIQGYQQAELVPKAQLEGIIQNLRLRLEEYELEAQQHQENVLAIANDYEAQTHEDDRVVRGYIDKMARLEYDNQQLKEQVASLSALKKFDAGAWGWGADIGNQVIDYLMAENIPCDALPLDFNPTDTHLTVALNCRTEAGLRMLSKDGKDFEKGMCAAKGWKDVTITLTGRVVKVTVQYANRAIAKVKPESVLERPVSDWEFYLGSEYHWFIAASTQSGKTTLVDELNALLYRQFEGEVEFHAITLKTDGNRDAEKEKRFVTPVFKATSQDYFEAQSQVLEEIESRKLILAVNPNHRYKRSVYQWDEYGEHYRIGGMKEVTKMVLISALQVGAGLSSQIGKGIQITFMVQNPLVSQLGLYRPDLANCCIIIVGEKNIRLFLGSDESNHGLDKEDLERLQKELSLFKEASRKAIEKIQKEAAVSGEDPRLAIAKCPERYYSLILPAKGGLKPVILYNPHPGQFTNLLTTTKEELPKKEPVNTTCEHEFKVLRTYISKDKSTRTKSLQCKKCGFKDKTVESL